MTPGARAGAAIELLDAIIDAAEQGGAAADTLIARYFKTRRYAGSKDRRAVRELIYRAIRHSGERPASGRDALIGAAAGDSEVLAMFDGSQHAPAPIFEGESGTQASLVPVWLMGRFDPLAADKSEHAALLERAPLDLRVNRLKTDRAAALEALGQGEVTPLSPLGIRLPEGTQIEQSEAWLSGMVEVQDEGSQWLALACGAEPEMGVVDLCAGGGGKTLALAAEMANRGDIVASDTDRGRLQRMPLRLERAGVAIVEPRLLDPGREREALADLAGQADLVLIDAPCSGTGTWRRNPEARWRLTPERLNRLTELQAHLIDIGAELVKPGGALVYAVCSLLAEEGRFQSEAVSGRHSALVEEPIAIKGGRDAGPGRLLTPHHDRTDGFFVARWRRSC